jgi:hypothetical protein
MDKLSKFRQTEITINYYLSFAVLRTSKHW